MILKKFEKELISTIPQIDTFHPNYQKALNQMLEAGGKRFRPMLLLNVVQSFEPLLLKNSIDIAIAIEYLHTYSLIHDDLPAMDNADLRRGKPTLHKSFDEVTAILIGDALNSESFYRISKAKFNSEVRIKLVEELAYNGGTYGMVLGQAIDCHFENQKLSLEDLKTLHINKTAKLIASSLKMGAIICELDKEFQNKIYDFGIKIGLLFQIQDDILDVKLDDKQSGKTTNNDNNKNSFVNLLGVDGAMDEAEKLVDDIYFDLESFEENLKKNLINLLDYYLLRHRDY